MVLSTKVTITIRFNIPVEDVPIGVRANLPPNSPCAIPLVYRHPRTVAKRKRIVRRSL